MIALVSGLPGTGKSLNCIKQFILPALKKGRVVYTNIDGLNKLAISIYLDMSLLEVENLLRCTEADGSVWVPNTQKIKSLPAGCLVVIDEAQIYWSNRAYNSQENLELLPLLQKHRHYGIDIIFATQNIDQVDVGIRRLCQVHYRLTKLQNVGLDKTVKVRVFPDAMGSEQFAPMSVIVWRIDKRIFVLYNSYQGQGIQETKSGVGNIILKNPKVIFAVMCMVITGYMVYNGIYQKKGQIFTAEKSLRQSVLRDGWERYYCAKEAVYIKYADKIDTMSTNSVPPGMCLEIGHEEIAK